MQDSSEEWQNMRDIQVNLPFLERPVTVVVPSVRRKRFWNQVGSGKWEPFTFKVFNQEILPETTYVGFGEWVGITGLFAMQRAGRTIMIDADPLVRYELRENVKRNAANITNIALDYRCISNATGKVGMSVHGGSMSSILDMPWTNTYDIVQVDCLPLPDLLQEYGVQMDGSKRLFIKIDTEGAESIIVPSLKHWLVQIPKDKLPTIYMSMHDKADASQRAIIAEVLNLFPFFARSSHSRSIVHDSNYECNRGVRLDANTEGNYFNASLICEWCDYLLVANDVHARAFCDY